MLYAVPSTCETRYAYEFLPKFSQAFSVFLHVICHLGEDTPSFKTTYNEGFMFDFTVEYTMNKRTILF